MVGNYSHRGLMRFFNPKTNSVRSPYKISLSHDSTTKGRIDIEQNRIRPSLGGAPSERLPHDALSTACTRYACVSSMAALSSKSFPRSPHADVIVSRAKLLSSEGWCRDG